ncbi:MAG TPA: RNA polymerase sigma-70 factor [Hanamia sp.]|jgi:RNA polymerase sigma-70 factor (family 1)|nr:RNA polymerase sigma-70 factor [Hanamia sp.]
MRTHESYTNDQLLDLLARSDESAFTEIYERFWSKLFAISYNRIGEYDVAEDVVHDVLASLWANRNKTKIESLENYLATATKYIVLHKIKKKERERVFHKSIEQEPVTQMSCEASLHFKKILEIVNSEIEKLPESCQLIFKYSRNDGMSVKDIAQQLNISPKTVENQVNKALKHLKLATRTFLHIFF